MKYYLIYIPLPFILLLGWYVSDITGWYFQEFEKGKIIKSAPVIYASAQYTPINKKHYPNNYDFVVVMKDKSNAIIESFYSKRGNITTNRFTNGKLTSSSTDCIAVKRALYYSNVGFIVFGIGALMFAVRTRQWFILALSKLPNRYEAVPLIYGMSMFAWSLFMPMPSCALI